MGLRCVNAAVDVGNAVLTVSSALLSALTTVAAISKQGKVSAASVKSSKPRQPSLSVAAFNTIRANLPDQVRLSTCAQICTAFCLGPAQ